MSFPSTPLPSAAERRAHMVGWINAVFGIVVTALVLAGTLPPQLSARAPQIVAVVVADVGQLPAGQTPLAALRVSR